MTSASDTRRLTVAQAVVTYLSRQHSVADGQRQRLIPATLGIFGHGNVAGLGQALDEYQRRAAVSSRAATSSPGARGHRLRQSTACATRHWP